MTKLDGPEVEAGFNTTLFLLSRCNRQSGECQFQSLRSQSSIQRMNPKSYSEGLKTWAEDTYLLLSKYSVKHCVPPMRGIVPKLISGKPNLASVEAKIMSHCTARSPVSDCSATRDTRSQLTGNANPKPQPDFRLSNCCFFEIQCHTYRKPRTAAMIGLWKLLTASFKSFNHPR
jgi:hypothetical protein